MIKILLKATVIFLFTVASVFSEVINDIEVSGNKRISKQTIIVLGNIDLGKNYSDDELNSITKELYNTEFFKDISLNLDNNILKVNVIENPIIEDIQIDGIKSDQVVENLLEKISLKILFL